jgi:hypothetical protein
MESNHAFGLFEKYREVVLNYGAFEFLAEDEVAQTDSSLVWSSCSFDDGEHIINGHSESSAVECYLKSFKPWDLERFDIDVIQVYYFECTGCDGESECSKCDEDNMVEMDFDLYLASTPIPERNPDTLWEFRKPYGFDYETG